MSLNDHIRQRYPHEPTDLIARDLNISIKKVYNRAYAMEKEQIIDAFREGGVKYSAGVYPEQYYNETYLQSHTPKQYRVWFPDTMEAIGGYWWNCKLNDQGYLYDPEHDQEELDTLEWYLQNGYKVEEVTNG